MQGTLETRTVQRKPEEGPGNELSEHSIQFLLEQFLTWLLGAPLGQKGTPTATGLHQRRKKAGERPWGLSLCFIHDLLICMPVFQSQIRNLISDVQAQQARVS